MGSFLRFPFWIRRHWIRWRPSSIGSLKHVKKYMKNKQKAGHQYARVTQKRSKAQLEMNENALSARNNILIMACYNHHLTWYSIIPYIPGTTTRGPLKSPAQFPVPAKAPISVETIFGYTCNVILPSMIIVTSFVSIAALPTQQTSSTAGQIEPGTNVPVLEAGFWLESFLSVDFNLGTIIGFFEGGGLVVIPLRFPNLLCESVGFPNLPCSPWTPPT